MPSRRRNDIRRVRSGNDARRSDTRPTIHPQNARESSLGLTHARGQLRKLQRLLRDAALHVPMYRALYAQHGLTGRELAEPGVLARLPVLTKAALLAVPAEDRVDERFKRGALARETTTGSTGQPFAIYLDRRYLWRRNARFLHGLLAVGYRPWHRLLLLTDRYTGLSRRHGWHYQSVECSAGELLGAYRKVRPDVLYGFATPLRLLAESLLRGKVDTHRPCLVVSTAEMLDAATRRTLENAFGCPVADFYGMTEMGLVAWQRPGRAHYTLAQGSVLTEFLPDTTCPGRYRMLMTNLELRASPIIRFDCGDLVFADIADGQPLVTAFEGRVIDAIVCRDGGALSPYRVTDALRDVPGVRRFQVTQIDLTRFQIALEVDAGQRDEAARRVEAIFGEMLGAGLQLKFAFSDQLVAEGSTKFRPVASRVRRE